MLLRCALLAKSIALRCVFSTRSLSRTLSVRVGCTTSTKSNDFFRSVIAGCQTDDRVVWIVQFCPIAIIDTINDGATRWWCADVFLVLGNVAIEIGSE